MLKNLSGMRAAILDRMLRRRQCLPEHLAAENLRATDVRAVAAKDIVFNPLELEQRDQILENRVHAPIRVWRDHHRRERPCR